MSEITLCLDFGNTRKKAAIFYNQEIKEIEVLEGAMPEEIKNIFKKYRPQYVILSSVVNHNEEIENFLRNNTHFHRLGNHSKMNFLLPVSKSETVGADRLAMAAAAVHFFPGKNNLIIGLGSCITYNFINQYNQFLGGAISPGKEMRFRAMHEFTAKLPLVEQQAHFPLTGYDTRTNLLSGVLNGIASEIDGMIEKYEEKYGNFNVVLTGGDIGYFATRLKYRIFADPDFLFKGMYAISKLNR
ncbi:MAG: type III pantothenate kinase [Ferruginibacter sp.]|nr:type III pantothenate kinase [Ferruginibacter sp.]